MSGISLHGIRLWIAYAAAGPAWKNFNQDGLDDDSISVQMGCWHGHAKQLDKIRSGSVHLEGDLSSYNRYIYLPKHLGA